MALKDIKIGRYLRRFRDDFSLKQKDVAEKIGIHPQLYLKYEKDESSPSVKVVWNIADAYHVTTDYLLGLSDEPRPPKLDADTMEFLKMAQAWKNSPAKVTA